MACIIKGDGLYLDGSYGIFQDAGGDCKKWMVISATSSNSGIGRIIRLCMRNSNNSEWLATGYTSPSSSLSRGYVSWRVE